MPGTGRAGEQEARGMATVVLIGTLDTKGAEYAWIADRVRTHGASTVTIDVGLFSTADADIGAAEVARSGHADLAALRAARDRGAAMEAMASGAASVALALHAEGRLDGVLAVGVPVAPRSRPARCGPCRSGCRNCWSPRWPRVTSRPTSVRAT
ncbi:Tm-1-like ATP-binding domain-containing protein [Streptomyces sp. NPDC056161]|uniref:Tm-1-like ATP-binding domain-containing protein n=1 Tax=Streptomyces sp. NPDC056161 TaxID=3345732 RepID=UPI0035D68235